MILPPRNGLGRSLLALIAAGAVGLGAAGAQAPRLLSPPSAQSQLSFADLVERVSPAVVSVMVEREVEARPVPRQLEEFFRFEFGFPEDQFENQPFGNGTQRMQAQGSGFFIDNQGHIVTNNHVIEGADKIEIGLPNGRTRQATLVGADPLTDLAVLKVEPDESQAFVEFAEEVNLRVGDWVVAVGNPFGLSGTVTSGIVSAIGGQGRAGQFLDFIQIDAPINRGNSGGPTFDLQGRVVGVNTAIYSTTGGSVGIGFAIPAKVAKETVAQLIERGAVTRGWLGVQIQDVTEDIARALGRGEARGALVTDVLPDTPAAKAGLRSGDVLLSVNGQEVADTRELTRSISALPPGARANIRYLRDGATRTASVTLGERTEQDSTAESQAPSGQEDSLAADAGLRISNLTQALRQQHRIPDDVQGVLVTAVRSGSPADDAGLTTGAVILQVDGQSANDSRTVRRLIDEARQAGKDAVLVRFQYQDVKRFGALRLPGQ